MKYPEKPETPSTRSVLGLNWMIFFMSDVRPGIGPFLSIFLKSQLNWSTDLIGIALGVTDLTAAICQIPTGLLVDVVRHKRFLLLAACLTISTACLLILLFPSFLMVVFSQALIGLSAAIIPPTIAAVTLGLVGRKRFPKRISINETWGHAGNVATAAIVGVAGYMLGLQWILYLVIACALISVFFMSFIDPKEIDNAAARELTESGKPLSIYTFIKESDLLIFCMCIFLFHFSNAAQLPLIGQLLSTKNPAISSIFMGACIILAQVVMILVAYSMGFLMDLMGRKPLFLFGLTILPLRAFLYTVTDNPWSLLSVQLLDGIGAGIFGVIGVVTISDIAKGTGRFNFSLGLMALSQGIGASTSNVVAGYVANNFGFNAGFFTLATIGLVGALFYGVCMPETKVKRT